MSLFRREPTIPLAFYEAQVELWSAERAALIARIQHPTVYQPPEAPGTIVAQAAAISPHQPTSAYSEEEERELALVGSVILGPEEGGGPEPAPKE